MPSDTTAYQRVAQLVSRIRNAKLDDMVRHVEELIEAGEWRDYTTPRDTHFLFQPREFDYFLQAQELDPTTIRVAYSKATEVPDKARKITRLADITGHGECKEGRRSRTEVAKEYATDPSGAGARIAEPAAFVPEAAIRVTRNPQLRKEYETTGRLPRVVKSRWHVDWRNEKTTAQAIADKLLADPDLAHQVYKILHSREVANAAKQKRRSEAVNSQNRPAGTGTE